MIDIWPESEQWTVRSDVRPRKYHGGSEDRSTFDGKQIRKLLAQKRFDHLNDIANEFPHELASVFVESFSALNNVIDKVMGNTLDPDWKLILDKFESLILKLEEKTKLTFIFKHHSLFEHLPYYADKYKAFGLGKYNEQAMESSHHQWNVRSSNYLIDVQNPDFDKVFNAGVTWNSRNA